MKSFYTLIKAFRYEQRRRRRKGEAEIVFFSHWPHTLGFALFVWSPLEKLWSTFLLSPLWQSGTTMNSHQAWWNLLWPQQVLPGLAPGDWFLTQHSLSFFLFFKGLDVLCDRPHGEVTFRGRIPSAVPTRTQWNCPDKICPCEIMSNLFFWPGNKRHSVWLFSINGLILPKVLFRLHQHYFNRSRACDACDSLQDGSKNILIALCVTMTQTCLETVRRRVLDSVIMCQTLLWCVFAAFRVPFVQ